MINHDVTAGNDAALLFESPRRTATYISHHRFTIHFHIHLSVPDFRNLDRGAKLYAALSTVRKIASTIGSTRRSACQNTQMTWDSGQILIDPFEKFRELCRPDGYIYLQLSTSTSNLFDYFPTAIERDGKISGEFSLWEVTSHWYTFCANIFLCFTADELIQFSWKLFTARGRKWTPLGEWTWN